MKRFLLFSIFIFAACLSVGQSAANPEGKKPGMYLQDGTKFDEYKKTFEIKNNPNPTAETLSKIDMSNYWKYIHKTQRVEVLDNVTGLTLILYSREETSSLIDYNTLLIVMPNEPSSEERKKTP